MHNRRGFSLPLASPTAGKPAATPWVELDEEEEENKAFAVKTVKDDAPPALPLERPPYISERHYAYLVRNFEGAHEFAHSVSVVFPKQALCCRFVPHWLLFESA